MNPDEPLRVVVADDHPIVRHGIADLLERSGTIRVISKAADGLEALESAIDLKPDVLVLDLRMPRMTGVEVMGALSARRSPVRVLILTTYENDSDILRAVAAGATGYLLKASSPDSIVAAVHAVANGASVLGPSIAERLNRLDHPQSAAKTPQNLSLRELQVIRLVANGKTNTEIASELFLSEPTVNTHLRRIFTKLDARNRAHAVGLAHQLGLLEDDPPR